MEAKLTNAEAPTLNPALLNERVAGVISTLSRVTHLSLQASSLLVEGFFEGAKYGTSAGLGLSRRTLVAAITTARSMHSQFLQVMDKYTNLGIYYVHTAFTLAELFALTGFQLTSTTISTSLHAADESVRIIDGLFGSTETSRALAAVVQLVRREMFEDDDYSLAHAGTLTALGGIVKALTVFSCLQVVTWHRNADSGSYRGQLSGPTLDTLAPFPDLPLPSLADRYMRHASAAYGPQFLHLLGLAQHHTFHLPRTTFHPNHHAFAEHTGIDVEDVLLSSFTPTTEAPEGGCHALVHYVSYDRAQKAVVLTLRGTMGLSDVLTDLCWDYATLRVGDVDYAVHAGMLEGAKRLSDPQGEVVGMVCRALKAEPTYGLIINGHSLGGGVAALLAIMWSQELPGPVQGGRTVGLPTGRRIRCIGFGVPCVMDAELGERYSSLITTIVHGDDVVPSLSLGIVRDFKNVAISLSEEKSVVEDIVRRCIGWERSRKSSFSSSKQDDPSFPSTSFPTPSGPEEADWFWSLIKTMRADMTAEKLCPPGQVYVVENTRAVLVDGEMRVRDTTRIRMVLVRDVRSRFGEVIFGRRMFTDHSPKYYEDALRALSQGARPPR
ncbi:MAG: Alpha/Beta hydrolase protein [Piptocephalis tieghemiana]|nr:MAG: Alpha/Beta hydrolase protein [Piptocephalis tieghemiana]